MNIINYNNLEYFMDLVNNQNLKLDEYFDFGFNHGVRNNTILPEKNVLNVYGSSNINVFSVYLIKVNITKFLKNLKGPHIDHIWASGILDQCTFNKTSTAFSHSSTKNTVIQFLWDKRGPSIVAEYWVERNILTTCDITHSKYTGYQIMRFMLNYLKRHKYLKKV